MEQEWVTRRTGAVLDAPAGTALLGLRRNPRRAHLLVSLLLGKHVPVPSGRVLGAAEALGDRVRDALGGRSPVVVGFAETATALGHAVAAVAAPDGGPAPYAHTTRRPPPAGAVRVHFAEEHSHAVEQCLAVLDDALLRDPSTPLVLVDDELSTGRTAVNAVRVLQQRWPRERYVLATLLDVRDDAQRAATAQEVARLGAELVDVSLVRGRVRLPPDLAERAAELCAVPEPQAGASEAVPVHRWTAELPAGTPLSAAWGWDAAAEAGLRATASVLADVLRPHLRGSVLVLGDEEFMHAAQRTAQALGPEVCTSSTSRSPALVVDEPGYPLRSALRFPSSDDPRRVAFAYDVAPSRHADRGTAPGFDHVVLVTDRPVRDGLATALAGAAGTDVHLAVLRPGAASGPVVTGGTA